ncbi:hypothetical protein [Maricaulis maris]|nr:hypothetical protein [Maricaulis maris]
MMVFNVIVLGLSMQAAHGLFSEARAEMAQNAVCAALASTMGDSELHEIHLRKAIDSGLTIFADDLAMSDGKHDSQFMEYGPEFFAGWMLSSVQTITRVNLTYPNNLEAHGTKRPYRYIGAAAKLARERYGAMECAARIA